MSIIYVSTLIGGLVLACDYLIIRMILWAFGLREFNATDNNASAIKRDKLPPVKADRSVKTLQPVNNRNEEIDETDDEDDEFEEEEEEEEYEEDFDDTEEAEYEDEEEYLEEDEDAPIEEVVAKPEKPAKGLLNWLKTKLPKEESSEEAVAEAEGEAEAEYDLPSVELLIESETHDYNQQMQVARRQARQLEEAFKNYNLNIKVTDIQCGPVIAQHEIELERGLRINRITNLTDDLAVQLRVPSVRIVAPIPGKNTVGVEVPNAERQLVRLRDVIEETPEKLKSKMAVPIFLGKDVAGAPMVIDLAQMPHLLIAGRTGTGKSVCLNSLIVSILMTRTPDECRMIMIDPKMVELSPYESIPHLMHPVVTDMKKAEAILAWAVDKMDQRYRILASAGVRQLSEYNALSEEELYRRIKPETDEEWDETPRSMPYMVIIADEMADLMMTAAKEVETHIIRLAAKSRAVGIHLVLATQKPTVDIITGLIKSNLPARIAFTVASQTDSRVILDCNGAEKLLGHGDMLFLKPGTSQVLRGQGTYVSDPEIKEIIASIATDSPDYVIELVELQTEDDMQGDGIRDPRDEMYNKAVEMVIREAMGRGRGRCSISWLQRKTKIGYQRSARIFDYMEEDGIAGPQIGQQPRDILITMQEWRSRMAALEKELGVEKTVDKPSPKRPQQQDSKKHDAHKSGRDSQPNIRAKPKTKQKVEPGVGRIDDVDDSMLVEVRPNDRQRPKPPGRKKPGQHVANKEANDYTDIQDDDSVDDGYVIEYDKQYTDEDDQNVYGVVPVADGDVAYDADGGEWEYEYEYVYEEVEADEEEFDEEPIDPRARYVEEMNVEAGGDWESEEDWDEDETDNEDTIDEEYDEYDYDEDWEDDAER
jgi:S-DNA-T family DNA segregation ATPase FtsK/SpoIIIE